MAGHVHGNLFRGGHVAGGLPIRGICLNKIFSLKKIVVFNSDSWIWKEISQFLSGVKGIGTERCVWRRFHRLGRPGQIMQDKLCLNPVCSQLGQHLKRPHRLLYQGLPSARLGIGNSVFLNEGGKSNIRRAFFRKTPGIYMIMDLKYFSLLSTRWKCRGAEIVMRLNHFRVD